MDLMLVYHVMIDGKTVATKLGYEEQRSDLKAEACKAADDAATSDHAAWVDLIEVPMHGRVGTGRDRQTIYKAEAKGR